jgi:hypothetical protein
MSVPPIYYAGVPFPGGTLPPSDGQIIRRSAAADGWVFADVPFAPLASDTDVSIASPADADVLTYNATSGKWENKPAATGGGSEGFSSLLKFRRTTLVVADGVNVIGANPSYSLGDIWTKVRSDNLIQEKDATAAPHMAATGFTCNNFGDQAGIYSKKNYCTGTNIHAMCVCSLLRATAIDFWFVLDGFIGPAYGAQGFAPNGSITPAFTGSFAAFRYSTSQSDAHLQAVSCDGSTATLVDTGVTPVANTALRLLILFDDANSRILYYINDALVATITTHLPAANTALGIELSASEPSSFASPSLWISQIAVQTDI